ncbi:hypothetical protein NG798_27005 [Ancylothrix sp. C2]|uniref:hypothetical protein n=1 Tax=Ancylothrix sp. D3o TaxID=2953691 RepID=UPI0021BAAA60|nr:hypothetical protein [Ancylothrix sp. D3o]MCT7953453.1 hypothetical protein [Ancylothrix sp. D3o]
MYITCLPTTTGVFATIGSTNFIGTTDLTAITGLPTTTNPTGSTSANSTLAFYRHHNIHQR